MTIRRGDTIGVCMGVKRALELVEKTRRENPLEPLATIGPLIHNRRVLENLAGQGVRVIHSPEEVSSGTVIIRAHGLSLKEKQAFLARPVRLLDGTCPRVLKSQELVSRKGKEGYGVIIVGDARHGEVKAIAGYAGDCRVVDTPESAETLALGEKTLVLGQTTIRQEEYDRICRILKGKAKAAGGVLEIAQTICPATRARQEALKKLSARTDALLVIGGRDSANTTGLFHTARELGKPVWHIEGAGEIPEEIGRFDRVGLTAGASTPDWIIREVEEALISRFGATGEDHGQTEG